MLWGSSASQHVADCGITGCGLRAALLPLCGKEMHLLGSIASEKLSKIGHLNYSNAVQGLENSRPLDSNVILVCHFKSHHHVGVF